MDVVRDLVRGANGQMRINTRPDKGCAVKVVFPPVADRAAA